VDHILDFGEVDVVYSRRAARRKEKMRRTALLLFAAFFLAGPACAEGERAGGFDYYVMALSWSPNWCAREGDAQGSDQCRSAPRP
jgi:ribonuclease I